MSGTRSGGVMGRGVGRAGTVARVDSPSHAGTTGNAALAERPARA